jgi:transcription-repair coupling factor (superfamily II helicase)
VVEEVAALAAELADRYGPPPAPVRNLLRLAGVRAQATAVGLTELVCFGGRARLFPVDDLPESKQVRLDRLYRGAIWKQAERTLLVPLPEDGANLPTWLCELLTGVLEAPAAPKLPDSDRPEHRRAAS